MLAFDDEQLEDVHDYVQWLFPVPEPSAAEPDSPVLTPADIEALRGEAERATALRALARLRSFHAGSTEWQQPFDHNQLRITRILRFLSVVGLNAEARAFFDWASTRPGARFGNAPWYWREALEARPAWLGATP